MKPSERSSNSSSLIIVDHEIAQSVRRKKFHERTREEHEWVSLDCRLRSEIYEVGFQPHPEFDLGKHDNDGNNSNGGGSGSSHDAVVRKKLYRLLRAPKNLQLAFGFMKDSRDPKVHSLLHKFYQVKEERRDPDDNDYLSLNSTQDGKNSTNGKECELLGVFDVPLIGRRLATLQHLYALVANKETQGRTQADNTLIPVQVPPPAIDVDRDLNVDKDIHSNKNTTSANKTTSASTTTTALDEEKEGIKQMFKQSQPQTQIHTRVIDDWIQYPILEDKLKSNTNNVSKSKNKPNLDGLAISPSLLSYFVMKESVRIVEKASCSIGTREEQCYSFTLKSGDENTFTDTNTDTQMGEDANIDVNTDSDTNTNGSRKLAGLTVSIVFHGSFDGETYIPGRLSASLSRIIGNGTCSNKERIHVGIANLSHQILNCHKKLGRLIIELDLVLEEADVSSGNHEQHYELIVTGFSPCQYSLIISGKVMVPIQDYFIDDLCTMLNRQTDVIKHLQDVHDVDLDVRVMNRKIHFLKGLVNEMDQRRLEVQYAIDEAEFELENGNDWIENRRLVKELERKYAHYCKYIAVRRDIEESSRKTILERNEEKERLESNIKTLVECMEQQHKALSRVYEKVCDKRLFSISKSILEAGVVIEPWSERSRKVVDSKLCINPLDTPFVQRTRASLREIDRVEQDENVMVASAMLHELPQLFPKASLLEELNRQLDSMINDLIRNEEIAHPLLLEGQAVFNEDEFSVNSFESDPQGEDSTTEDIDDELDREEQKCVSCGSQCSWSGYITNYSQVLSKREELTHFIIDLKKQRSRIISNSAVSESLAQKEVIFYQAEMLHDALREANDIDDELQLHRIDKELHDAYNTQEKQFIVTRSLHRYDCMMDTKDAIFALAREQERLVAKVVAKEIVHDVLDWMDHGWYFDPPNSSGVEKGRAEQRVHEYKGPSQESKITKVHEHSLRESYTNKTVTRNALNSQLLDGTERSVKMCLFSSTLRYFQSYNSFKKHKAISQRDSDLFERPISTKSSERLKMEREELNAKIRDEALKKANEAALKGTIRIQRRKYYESSVKIQKIVQIQNEISLQNMSAVTIQKLYRGRLGRKVGSRWKFEIRSVKAWSALCQASAIAISRYWRGYSARVRAEKVRIELTNYIIELRRVEAEVEDDEYWESLYFGKIRRERDRRRRAKLLNEKE